MGRRKANHPKSPAESTQGLAGLQSSQSSIRNAPDLSEVLFSAASHFLGELSGKNL